MFFRLDSSRVCEWLGSKFSRQSMPIFNARQASYISEFYFIFKLSYVSIIGNELVFKKNLVDLAYFSCKYWYNIKKSIYVYWEAIYLLCNMIFVHQVLILMFLFKILEFWSLSFIFITQIVGLL